MKFFCVPLFGCKYAVVDTLDYSQQHLEDIPKEIYRTRKFLEELNLSVNKIETLPPEFFRCPKLKKLDVSENKLKELPPEVGYLQCLMDLNISNNEFVDLPEELGACINLITLNISTNIVPELPKSIINLTLMTSLVISNNPLTQLPTDIDQLVNLQHLDAGQCELRFLPASIVRLRRLRILDLCENYLTELPDEMNGLASLETLDIRKNMLSAIPVGLLGCTVLKNLDLADNNITQLPLNIGDLTRLTELSLCDNKIITIPSSIGQMKYLESLKMSRNSLDSLTPAICSCYALQDLSLSDNKLTELPSSLGNLKKLRFFDASNNQLTKLPSTIGGCTSLGVLALRQNKLKSLPMEIGKLEKLKVLDVANNDLTYLPYTITVLYEAKNISALWLSLHQPPLPKLIPTYEPTSNIKVLTCCYLPQSGIKPIDNHVSSKSCVGGARVCFSSQLGSTNDGTPFIHDDEDEDDKLPIGKFERYDTPHPKPFAPKNRFNRNSGDFTQATANNEAGSSHEQEQESRPLRSVLKRRPASTYSVNSQDEAALLSQLNESRTKVIRLARQDGSLGWSISGGRDSHYYKGKAGFYISNLAPGGAAELAGFRVDDRIVEINETRLSAFNHLDLIQLIEEAGSVIHVKIERIPEGEPTDLCSALDHKNSEDNHPISTLDLPILSAEPRPPSRQLQSLSTALPTLTIPPLAEAESSSTTLPGLSPPIEKADIFTAKDSTPDIIALVLKRDSGGSAGFSIAGNGESNDPIRISELTPNGPAHRSGKLSVGDRIRSVNGVDMRNVSQHRAAALLNSTNDIYLVVEKSSSTTQFLVASKPLSRTWSSPSLVTNNNCNDATVFNAPPLPPRRTHSRAALLDELEFSKFDISKFDFKTTIKNMASVFLCNQPQHFQKSINTTIPTKPRPEQVSISKTSNPGVENMMFNIQHEKPLATSSPIPPQMAPAVPSKIPVKSIRIAPPPIPPKPKLDPENSKFMDKLKSFENMSKSNNVAPPLKGLLPNRKPLVSEQDRLKLKEDENRRQQQSRNGLNPKDHEASPSSDPNYEHLLVNSVGPSVIRTKTAENRLAAISKKNDSLNESIELPSMSSMDSVKELEADRIKRQQWRQERLNSMDQASENGDQMIRMIKNVTPIPTGTF